MIALLNGCGQDVKTLEYQEGRIRAELYDGYRILTDRETGVQYLSRGESLVVMVDHDGKPLIANGWRDYD